MVNGENEGKNGVTEGTLFLKFFLPPRKNLSSLQMDDSGGVELLDFVLL